MAWTYFRLVCLLIVGATVMNFKKAGCLGQPVAVLPIRLADRFAADSDSNEAVMPMELDQAGPSRGDDGLRFLIAQPMAKRSSSPGYMSVNVLTRRAQQQGHAPKAFRNCYFSPIQCWLNQKQPQS